MKLLPHIQKSLQSGIHVFFNVKRLPALMVLSLDSWDPWGLQSHLKKIRKIGKDRDLNMFARRGV